jgi:hypothetical protein
MLKFSVSARKTHFTRSYYIVLSYKQRRTSFAGVEQPERGAYLLHLSSAENNNERTLTLLSTLTILGEGRV